MKISKFMVENYGCLRKVELGLGEFTVIIGKNGSGKSFFLEALNKFFSEFNPIGGGVPPGLNDYLWYDRNTENPIKFSVSLGLDNGEIKEIFPLPANALRILRTRMGIKYTQLEICRNIDMQSGWKTEYVKWAGLTLIKEDKMITPEDLNKLLQAAVQTSDYVFYLFRPGTSIEKISGNRLLVNTKKKVAYYSNSQIDSLVKSKVIPCSTETLGLDYKEWVRQQGYKLLERPPRPDEAPQIIPLITADILQKITTSMSSKIKGQFQFVPAARDVKAGTGMRISFLDSAISESLRTLSISTTRADEIKWNRFRSQVEEFFSKRLVPNPTQLLVEDHDLRLPTSHIGGGEQEIMQIGYLMREGLIIGIEEPENHFHPGLARKFFDFLKTISKQIQIVITTHSPMFVDKINISNNWIFSKKKKETKVKKIENRDEFKLVLAELGVVPSDIYLKDFVIFVEGGTERDAVLPIFADKLKFDIEKRVAIVSSGGIPRVKDFLRIWLELAKYAPVDYHILLDEDGEKLVVELIQEMDIEPQRFHVLEKGSIEDYYPVAIVLEAINKLFDLEITEKDIVPKKPLAKGIRNVLEKNRKLRRNWKIDIGRYVAEKMSIDQIPREVKELIDYLKVQS